MSNYTERLQYRDKSEKLLACLEGIDEDILAEAAQAVRTRRLKTGKPWFHLSNIAAVFVGVMAISCVLLLAFWLGNNLTPGEVPVGPNGYATPSPTPNDNDPLMLIHECEILGLRIELPADWEGRHSIEPIIWPSPIPEDRAEGEGINVRTSWGGMLFQIFRYPADTWGGLESLPPVRNEIILETEDYIFVMTWPSDVQWRDSYEEAEHRQMTEDIQYIKFSIIEPATTNELSTLDNEAEIRQAVEAQPLPFEGWLLRYIQFGQDHTGRGHAPNTITIFYEPQDFATAVATINWESEAHWDWETGIFRYHEFEYLSANLFELIEDLQEITVSIKATFTEGSQIDTGAYNARWSITREPEHDLDFMLWWYDNPSWEWPERNEMGLFEGVRLQHAGALEGAIVIVGNYLYLDPVEIVFSTDYERVAELFPGDPDLHLEPKGFTILTPNVQLIWPNQYDLIEYWGVDPEAVAAANLEGWPYEHPIPQETLRFEITQDTVFQFVDTGLRLPTTNPQRRRNSSTCLESFVHYLQGRWELDPDRIGSSTFRRIPFFVQVDEYGRVISVTEEFFLTQ